MEFPANIITPTAFCERIKKEAEGLENVEVIIRDEGPYAILFVTNLLYSFSTISISLGCRKGDGIDSFSKY